VAAEANREEPTMKRFAKGFLWGVLPCALALVACSTAGSDAGLAGVGVHFSDDDDGGTNLSVPPDLAPPPPAMLTSNADELIWILGPNNPIPQTLTITNRGGSRSGSISVQLTGTVPTHAFRITAYRCVSRLNPGASCELVLEPSPLPAAPVPQSASTLVISATPGGTLSILVKISG
jgi:hypothetical protein